MALWEITIQQLSNRDARERWVCEIQYDRRRPPLRAQSFDEMISLIRLEHDTILAQKAKKVVSRETQPFLVLNDAQMEDLDLRPGPIVPVHDEPLPPQDAEQHAATEEAVTAPVDAAAPEQGGYRPGTFERATDEQIAQGKALGLDIKGNWSARRAQAEIDARLAGAAAAQ